MGGFQRVFEDNGGKVVKKLWPPLVTPDYTPYIAQIARLRLRVQRLRRLQSGEVHERLCRSRPQGQDPAAGRLDRRWTTPCCKSLGDEAIGVVSAACVLRRRSTPTSNKRFVAGMQKDYDVLPGGYAGRHLHRRPVVEAALEKLGGKSDDKQGVGGGAAARCRSTDTPRGPVKFDHLGNVVGDFFIRSCEKKDGKLVNKTIKTYHNVSQFWTYDEKKFLAQPGLFARLSAGQESDELIMSAVDGAAIAGRAVQSDRV